MQKSSERHYKSSECHYTKIVSIILWQKLVVTFTSLFLLCIVFLTTGDFNLPDIYFGWTQEDIWRPCKHHKVRQF